MSAWRRIGDDPPPRGRAYLVRSSAGSLPRVGVRDEYGLGWRLSFKPLEGSAPGHRGEYLENDQVHSWQWAEIPE